MGLLTVNKENSQDDLGVLYLIEIEIADEGKFVKAGITSKSRDPWMRWSQITASIWKAYRSFGIPGVYPKRYRKVADVSLKEKQLLDYLSEYQYSPKKRVDGATEMFKLELDLAAWAYELVYEGKELPSSDEHCEYCGKEKKFEIDGRQTCAHNCEVKLGVVSQ
jgi:hypothetical protein